MAFVSKRGNKVKRRNYLSLGRNNYIKIYNRKATDRFVDITRYYSDIDQLIAIDNINNHTIWDRIF